MTFEDRFLDLEDTLRRVATFATILSPDGISIRMLNHIESEQGLWDNLKTVEDVKKRMDEVVYDGSTPLGTKLRGKVLKPMLSKAASGNLKKPVIVVIITDGEESTIMA